MIVLDTNVVSELIAPTPVPTVISWFARMPTRELHTTAITEAELFFGVARLQEGKRKRDLEKLLERLFRLRFHERVLPFDSAAARNFGEILAERKRHGLNYHYADTQIAAIARSRGASVATRNILDFEQCGIAIIDPWATKD
jgi:predicted nucleic acid-binding protein